MCSKVCKCVFFVRWTFLCWKSFKTIWERGFKNLQVYKMFLLWSEATYNVLFFFKFHWDGCKSNPKLVPNRANPWHLSIVRTKVGTMGICSIETMKLRFGSLMNTFHSNIGWIPIMSSGGSWSKSWSWPSNFVKTILGNMDETSIVYPKVSSMTWWCVVAIFGN